MTKAFANRAVFHTHFSALEELDRRHCLEQSLYWDFQSLSNYSDKAISPAEGVTLCQMAHGSYFSASKWEKFVSSRVEGKSAPLSWNDVRVFLCQPLTGAKRENQNQSVEARTQNSEDNFVKLLINLV